MLEHQNKIILYLLFNIINLLVFFILFLYKYNIFKFYIIYLMIPLVFYIFYYYHKEKENFLTINQSIIFIFYLPLSIILFYYPYSFFLFYFSNLLLLHQYYKKKVRYIFNILFIIGITILYFLQDSLDRFHFIIKYLEAFLINIILIFIEKSNNV